MSDNVIARWQQCPPEEQVEKGLKPVLTQLQKLNHGGQLYKFGGSDVDTDGDELHGLDNNDAIFSALRSHNVKAVYQPEALNRESADVVYYDEKSWTFYATKAVLDKLGSRLEYGVGLGMGDAPKSIISNFYTH